MDTSTVVAIGGLAVAALSVAFGLIRSSNNHSRETGETNARIDDLRSEITNMKAELKDCVRRDHMESILSAMERWQTDVRQDIRDLRSLLEAMIKQRQ